MTQRDGEAIDALERVVRERDFYRNLLALGTESEFEPFLKEALALVVELTSARQAYFELRDADDESEESTWWLAHGCTEAEVDQIRTSISRGIIAETLSGGETVVTQSALLDERFRDRASVRIARIEAVICVPVGEGSALGVLYVQDRMGGGPFSDQDRDHAESFARHIAPLAERLVARQRIEAAEDATRGLRGRFRLSGVVGRSRALAKALEQAMLAAPLDVTVLLTGDSGTGKTQLARAIHANSARSDGPFVELNCAALPPTLLESELFGARAGSHSEARRDRRGRVASACGGTLFLDEVGEMPLESQAKLLQLLQSKTYYPLGADEPERADVRVVAASNLDLEESVRQGRFRQDLLFRLQVLPVRLPSLRERPDDLSPLARALAEGVARRNDFLSRELSPGALRAIEAADWPGNVRQLENAIEAASIRAAGQDAALIEARHLFPDAEPEAGGGDGTSYQEATRRFQRTLLEQTLRETGWNVAEAARRLDLARSHVYNLIGAFELHRS